jgi:predicted SAM-dependent methyltransferase
MDERLHIGCGPSVYPGWVNIDKSPSVLLGRFPVVRKLLFRLRLLTPEQARGFPEGVVFADVSRRIPAASASVEYIYCSHMIEHLSRWQALDFVRECHRVLRPDGVLRLATPDLELMVRDYVDRSSPFMGDGLTASDAFCAEYGAYADDPGNQARRILRKLAGGDNHQWLYDEEGLRRLLVEGGFETVDRCRFRQGSVPELERIEHRERGLFVEARRHAT